MSSFPLYIPSKENYLMTLSQEGPLFILHMHNKSNRLTAEFCSAVLEALLIVENIFLASEDPVGMALVTIGSDKIYSDGLDLKHVLSTPNSLDAFQDMLKRMVKFCIPTVAAINGHAFAGGCMLAMAHDYRVMRSDRGFICMSEVDINFPIPQGMSVLLRDKMRPKTFRDMFLQAHRFTAQESLDAELVDIICPNNEVLDQAKKLALKWAPKAKSGIVYAQLKDEMYSGIIAGLCMPFHRLAPKL